MTLAIIFFSVIFSLAFLGLGSKLNQKLRLNYHPFLMFPVGYIGFLGISQFFIYPWVHLKWQTIIYFTGLAILLIISILWGIRFIFNHRKDKSMYLFGLMWIVFVVWMSYLSSRQSLGQNSFDYTYYLSMVNHNANASWFGRTEFGSGQSLQGITVQYDFQSYYALGSFLLALYEPIQRLLSPNLFLITSGLYVWVFNLLFFSFEFTFFIGVLAYFKRLRSWTLLVIGLIVLGYFSSIYYNMVFAFFGNSLRTWIVSFLMFEVWRHLAHKSDAYPWLMIISSALIAVSSSGFFLGIEIFIVFVLLVLKEKKSISYFINRFIWILIPTLIFALNYKGVVFTSQIVIVLALIVILLMLKKIPVHYHNKLLTSVRYVFWFGIPTLIIGYSFYFWMSGQSMYPNFFQDHRAYDMVWYFFNHESFFKIFLNSLFWLSFLGFILSSKSSFKWFMVILVVLFLNPFTVPFLYRFLASVVYYRSFELIFNPFTLFLFYDSLMESKSPNTLKVYGSLILYLILIPNVWSHSFYYYHDSFIPDQDYNSLYKLKQSQIEPLSVLKTKVQLEGYQNAKIISQIEVVLSYVPQSATVYSNETIRGLDKYSIREESSKLLNIFVVRDYIGQKIFDVEPDYANTCTYLMDEKVDFVVVDKNQFYIDDQGTFTPLYFRVRDCATPIYENEDYFIYQFYWE